MRILTLFAYAELQDFLVFTTGCPFVQGNDITIAFSYDEANAFTASTCGKMLTISAFITEYDAFASGLRAVMSTKTFTMP